MDMEKTDFIRCSIRGNETRDKVRKGTILENLFFIVQEARENVYQMVRQTRLTFPKGLGVS